MGFRFWRRVRIAPGLTLNLGKRGGSLSIGPRGAKCTIGPRGRRMTAGLPGTGLFYTIREPGPGRRNAGSRGAKPPGPPPGPPAPGWFRSRMAPAGEMALVAGCRELARGHSRAALRHFERAPRLADAAFLAGFLRLQLGEAEAAIPALERALSESRGLGRALAKHGLALALTLPITRELSAEVGATRRGALLALIEACQVAGRWDAARAALERLRALEPDDCVVLLSLAELLWESGREEDCRRIVKLAKEAKNRSPTHAALLLYKARALRRLGLNTAARDTLTGALRPERGRPGELLLALRYERAMVYSALGQPLRARRDLETLFARDPDYEDVARRLAAGGGERTE